MFRSNRLFVLAANPGRVAAEIIVPFPYPRTAELARNHRIPATRGPRHRHVLRKPPCMEDGRSSRDAAPKSSWWLPPTLAGAAILALWYGAMAVFKIPGFILPAPHEILAAVWRERASLFPAAWRTGGVALAGFGAAVLGGAVLALILASSRWVKAALYPWVLVVQMVPVVVMVPIFVIWWGAGTPSILAFPL